MRRVTISPSKPNAGRAAALMEEARTIMAFITGEAEATSADAFDPDGTTAPLPDPPTET